MGNRGHWGTRLGFIMAASGSAIGLGNVWKFPYITGVHGGGAFVLIYIICIALIGIPILLAEFIVGRSTERSPVAAFEKLEGGKKNFWLVPGYMGVIVAFIILSYYSVVAGWVLDYTGKAVSGTFGQGHDVASIKSMLGNLLSNGHWQVVLHALFMGITTFIVMFGVKKGLEKASDILMPVLFVILLCLFGYSFTLSGAGEALSFLFSPNFDKLTPAGVIEAMGHSFFTLSVAMGIMITYGSYLNRDQHLVRTSLLVVLLDTMIALMAGVMIFSIVFSFGLDAGGGPTLIFSTLPTLFAQMPGGSVISIGFFILLSFAALTSGISIMEVVVAYLIDTFDWERKKAAFTVGIAAFVLGLLSAYSYNALGDFKIPVAFIFGEDLVFFDFFDKVASNIFLPLGGLLISIYVGWKLDRKILDDEFIPAEKVIVQPLVFILKYIAPVAIAIVFLYGLHFTNPLFEAIGISH